MPTIFGIDIAGTLLSATRAAGGLPKGTLTRRVNSTPAAGSATAAPAYTETSHAFDGFFDDTQQIKQPSYNNAGTTVQGGPVRQAVRKVTILGASISPATVPQINDYIVIPADGPTVYKLDKLITRDPAAATYTFQASAR